MLPFTREAFLAVFAAYNDAVWPAQIAAYLLAIAAVGLILRPSSGGGRSIAAILALMWAWTGLAYHVAFFAAINRPAFAFGALFVVQAALLVWYGVVNDRLRFGFDGSPAAWIGAAFVLYATLVYPLLSMATGHVWPALPMFGITPCPVTIFTFGMLLMTTARVPRVVLAIPFLWSLIGGSAAVLLSVQADWLLLASGVAAIVLLMLRDRGMSAPRPAGA